MGWWVFSSTMELDPFVVISCYNKDQFRKASNPPILMTIVRCFDRLMMNSVRLSWSILTVQLPQRLYTVHP